MATFYDPSDDTPGSSGIANDNTSNQALINSLSGATDTPYQYNYRSGMKTVMDKIQDPSTGAVTTYYSDGSTDTEQPTQGAQNVQVGAPQDITTQIKNLLTGNSSAGTAGQLASIAGIGALLNSIMGSGGASGYAGYQGSIPKYSMGRQQYATPQMQTGGYEPNVTSQNSTAAQRANMISPDQLATYLKSGNLSDVQIANQMNRYGVTPSNLSGITGIDPAAIQQRYNQAMGPNAQLGKYRPGQGGITYFSPSQYQLSNTTPVPITPVPTTPTTPVAPVQAAGGGMMGISSLGGYSDGGRLLKGPGDGVSDSIPASIGNRQPARLADGEFVVPARIVSELGNGSTAAGARKLYEMMDRVKHARSKAKNIAADTKASKYLPA
jgi:hypothetical protein